MSERRNFGKLRARDRLMRPPGDPPEFDTRRWPVGDWRVRWPEEFPVTVTMMEGKPNPTANPSRESDEAADAA
jgi:hypothetical protein